MRCELRTSVCRLPKFKKPKSLPKLILLTVREAVVKLVLSPIIVLWRDGEERYPTVPSPLVVDWRVKSKKGDEISTVVPADKYPKVPNPLTVD